MLALSVAVTPASPADTLKPANDQETPTSLEYVLYLTLLLIRSMKKFQVVTNTNHCLSIAWSTPSPVLIPFQTVSSLEEGMRGRPASLYPFRTIEPSFSVSRTGLFTSQTRIVSREYIFCMLFILGVWHLSSEEGVFRRWQPPRSSRLRL